MNDDEEAGGGISADQAAKQGALLQQIRELPNKASGIASGIASTARAASGILAYLLIVFLLFIVHQLFIWFDREPEAAFNQAAQALEIAEIVWDFNGRTLNMHIDLFNAAIVPVWNAVAFYWVEPLITLLVEIFYDAFIAPSTINPKTGKRVPFDEWDFISDADVSWAQPYIDCTKEAYSAEWCGRFGFYANRLESVDKAEGYADQSDQYRKRRLYDEENELYVFDIPTARRLAMIAPEGEFIAPAFDTNGIVESVTDFSSLGITIGATAADGGAAVFFDAFKQGFSFVFDAILKILKTALETTKMLIKSGMLTTLLNIGIDATIIYYTEIYIPFLFFMIDLVMCLVNLFQPDTWTSQLQCVAAKCFQSAEMETDLMAMSSVPVMLKRAASIADAVVNSKTFKPFVNNKKVNAKDRVWDPENQSYVPNVDEPEGTENPRPRFSPFVAMTDHWFTPELDACRACFACRVPEIRLLWLLSVWTQMAVSPTGLYKFAGNVSQECQNNQTGYIKMCGAPGTESLPLAAWRDLKERSYGTLGYDPIDPRIQDTFAAAMMDRARQTDDVDFWAAANAWERRDKGAEPGEQGVAFHYQMCRIMRTTQMHADYGDGGPMYHEYAENSKSYIVGHYIYERASALTLHILPTLVPTRPCRRRVRRMQALEARGGGRHCARVARWADGGGQLHRQRRCVPQGDARVPGWLRRQRRVQPQARLPHASLARRLERGHPRRGGVFAGGGQLHDQDGHGGRSPLRRRRFLQDLRCEAKGPFRDVCNLIGLV